MKDQKFKKGNLVRVLFGHPMWIGGSKDAVDTRPEQVGELAIIEYSYAERYGGGNIDDYSIIWLETGYSESWKTTKQMELVEEGGEYLFEIAEANRERISKQSTDIDHVVSKLESGSLSSESILMLFELIGFTSSFNRNGEYFVLYNDWRVFYPVFKHIMKSKTIEEAGSIFTSKGLSVLTLEKAFDALHKTSRQ